MARTTRALGGLLAAATLSSPVAALGIAPGQGVRILQQDFSSAAGVQRGTRSGVAEVDLPRLRKATGLPSGYLNLSRGGAWVVRNVPLPGEDAYPYAKLAVEFDLGISTSTAKTSLSLSYTDTVLLDYTDASTLEYEVEPITLTLGGAGTEAVSGAPKPPTLADLVLGDPAGNDTVVQLDHPNIEAAHNACMPTAVANSLQFLENTQGLPVPHEHKPGLTPALSPGDDSLVGRLEQAMGRQLTSRRSGEGVWGLQGKLRYLAQNGLADRVQVRHWGQAGPDSGSSDVSISVGGSTARSTGSGAKPSFDDLLEAMRDGQNCEAVYAWPGGRHAVDLVGVGRSHGRPWIVHSSDLDQASDRRGAGPSGLRFEFLTDSNRDGRFELNGSDRELESVICEKALPPPATVTVLELTDPRGHACCVDRPPATVSLIRSGRNLSITGRGASWMPLSGTIDSSGRFDLGSRATVAGFPSVQSQFTGQYANGIYEGTLTIGTRGELFGVPLSYRLRVSEAGVTVARPAMRVNGYRRAVTLRSRDAILVSVSLQAAASAGRSGDWWLAVYAPDGQWYHFDLARQLWLPGLQPSYSGPLFDIAYFGLPTLDGLPPGTYGFYFGFDGDANGQLDTGSAVYEATVVTIDP